MRNRRETFEHDPLNDYNLKTDKNKVSIHSVPSLVAILFVIFILTLFPFLKIFNTFLPTPLGVKDEGDHPDAFISERAIHDLKLLTAIGPRVTGSYENEVLTVSFFRREISFIEQRTHPNQKLEIDFQTVSGSYWMDFKPNGAIHAYSKVQNVVVKLHGQSPQHSLLLNSHFDTVPTSPGGSDDGINCVIMLEILRKLSRFSERLQHNVIFLFNGAEEAVLKASHGFITKHKWADEVRAVINLEAGGAGGKEYLFQSNNRQPWILDYYKQVPHPTAQVIGEELFQSGIIPSDTDYRIFRDFKNVSGLDFAFVHDGYRYHTKYDQFQNIPSGTYQHTGDNILKLTKLMGNALELPNFEEVSEKWVFYDFFGYFLIYYKHSVAVLLNLIISFFSIALAMRSFFNLGVGTTRQSIWYILITFLFILFGWVLSGITVGLTAITLDFLKSTMSWYGNQCFVLGLYVMPTLACLCGSILLQNYYNQSLNLSVAAQTQLQIHAVRLICTLMLLIGTYFEIRSVYLLLIPILFQTATFVFIEIFSLQYSVKKWQLIYISGTLISCLFLINVWQLLSAILIAVCGRIGSDRNPEIIIGFYTSVATILTLSCYVPLITTVNKGSTVVKFLLGIFMIIIVLAITPVGFPYSGSKDSPTPQRFWIYHTSRTFHNDSNHVINKNAGFFILNWDRNSPHSIRHHVRSLTRIKSIEDDCNEALFCGLPLASSRVVKLIRDTTWVPAGQPIIHEPTILNIISKNKISDTIMRFNFSAIGPSHMHVAVSARQNATLIATNLVDKLPKNTILWNDKPTYVILYTWGVKSTPLSFTLDFEVLNNWEGPIFDIAISGRYMHNRTHVRTPQFVQFLSEFPNWADVVPYLATYSSWVY